MNGFELRQRRTAAQIAGKLLCLRARIDRSRLSHIERGYLNPSDDELARITQALEHLIDAKQEIEKTAERVGWPSRTL